MSYRLKIEYYGNNFRRHIVKNRPILTDAEITEILTDSVRITKMIQLGINAALLKHKQMGNPVCAWRDNKIVWIPPEEIVIKF